MRRFSLSSLFACASLFGCALLSACNPGTTGPGDDGGTLSCTGCVDMATMGCVRGTVDDRCGTGGAACVACGDGEECQDGACAPRGGCNEATCPGCCRGDVCVAIERDDACGSGGAECVSCARGESCVDGTCLAASACGPESCGGCCTDGDVCEDGTDVSACGRSGGLCEACADGWTCVDGTCEPPCEEWCGGCCDAEGRCQGGAADAACGDAGGACVDCGAGAECRDGACVDLSCAETCGGCCEGGACLDGDLGGACGSGGDACVDCGPAFTCASGTCMVDPLSRWDLRAVRASFSPLNPSGSSWDTGSGPDAYLTAEVMTGTSAATGQTTRDDDTTSPFWFEVVLTDVRARDLKGGITMRIRDFDSFSRDDDIGYCYWLPSDGAFSRGRVVLRCPARSADPETVEVELVVYLERH